MALERFRGPGKISQMIALVESATPERREALLRSIALENPGLGALIQTKVLTLSKILQWNSDALASLLKQLSQQERAGLILLASRDQQSPPHLTAAWELAFHEKLELAPNPSQLRNAEVLEINLIHRIRELERLGLFRVIDADPAQAA